jgi:formate dehydrogenase alpha subunit
MVSLTINGKEVIAEEGATILEAAHAEGITIPTLCYHKDLSPSGSCRLCVVWIKGESLPKAACTYPVSEGMVVKTETPALRKYRKYLLEMLLSTYFDRGDNASDGMTNELLSWARYYKVNIAKASAKFPRYEIDSDPNPFIFVDLNKCIVCGRCIRACAEIQGRFVWGFSNRGYETKIVAGLDQPLLDARCESCGACAAYCPTGALDNKMSIGMGIPDKVVTTTCPYCGVGCTIDLHVRNNQIIRVMSNPDGAVNGMRLCVKGRYGYDFVHHPDRLTKPLVRHYLLDDSPRPPGEDRGFWVEVDWETALSITARRLSSTLQTHGSNSIGILTSAKCTNEENYLMNKFSRQIIGTNNIDHCARLCHSSTVAGLATSFGSGAMTNSIDDIVDFAESIFVIGSNTTEQHPVIGNKIRQAVLQRGVKLIVVDPRKIDLTEFATLHLQLKSGTDVALLNGLMNIILQKGYEDKEFIAKKTENYDEFKTNILEYTPEIVSQISGVPVEQLYEAAEILGHSKPCALFWAMGITQHIVGVQNVRACANLQMMLGNVGVPGGGVNPLRGQNNVQGACDMGGLPNVYPGYQPVVNQKAKEKFESAWGTNLSSEIGLTVTEMIPGIPEQKIKALYILGEDPILSDPDSNHVRHCLEELDFMVLQEIFPTETAYFADVLLPGVSFAEKTGTFTNTERRVQLVNQAIPPIIDAQWDWKITAEIAKRMMTVNNRSINLDAPYAGWDYSSVDQIMAEIAALTPSYAGISFDRLQKGERLQWPVKSLEHSGTPILHKGQFARGMGLFAVTRHIPPYELPDEEYPFVLNTGRVLYHWHGGELTRRARGLLEVYGQSLVEINPEDAHKLGLGERSRIRVTSRRGQIEAEVWITDRVPTGMVYANFHFPDVPTNALTISALDPVAKIPEYKICAVKIIPVQDD